MENPPFWWYLPGKMGFSWAMLVSGRVELVVSAHWTTHFVTLTSPPKNLTSGKDTVRRDSTPAEFLGISRGSEVCKMDWLMRIWLYTPSNKGTWRFIVYKDPLLKMYILNYDMDICTSEFISSKLQIVSCRCGCKVCTYFNVHLGAIFFGLTFK